MAEYIKLDEALDAVSWDTESYTAINMLDTVEIIHCMDCEHWDRTWTNDFAPNYHYCPMVDGTRKDDFYCADAEEREDG